MLRWSNVTSGLAQPLLDSSSEDQRRGLFIHRIHVLIDLTCDCVDLQEKMPIQIGFSTL
jgi:hypothetical protein